MRKVLLILAALIIFFAAAPANASEYEMGMFSIGLGGGFGDEVDVGPFVLSGKYWDPAWELGVDCYWSGDEEDEYDQLGMAWLAYRYDLSVTDDGAGYAGIGGAGIFENHTGFENEFGIVGILGWDADIWGVEFKYAYFDPAIYSVIVYYHFE